MKRYVKASKYIRASNGIYNITNDLLLERPLNIPISLRDAIMDTDTRILLDTIDKVWFISHGFPRDLSKSAFAQLKQSMAELYPNYTYEGDSYYDNYDDEDVV